ncbi:ATP-dependent DNA helicase RecG [Thermohalobacter berrensis]|uniref:ATP-dependent DNA helicase RecG n=1 Tax=Thermohalobacter berrensis TaxID=99594 RepID=A0A419TA77_9FIRM|nr:ATP-dependent DNA helicase RecG [Thermohalobacter berrensis]RKD34373.1 ATP-dependent DNA helicase RecG [Thermohalobacter berrensis]
MENLNTSIQYVKGVGPKRAKKLKRLNIKTVEDMLYYFPRTYEDRRKLNSIKECRNGEKVNLKVIVSGSPVIYRPRRGLSITKVPVKDETGLAFLVWFNQEYMAKNFKIGEILRVNGKVKIAYNEIQIQNPVFDKNDRKGEKVGKIIPIYPLTEKLSNNEMIKIANNVLKNYIDKVEDCLPDVIRKNFNLISVNDALKNIHFPKDRKCYIKARQRLVFEELLILQLGLLMIKENYSNNKNGIKFNKVDEIKKFINTLPFELTNAQKRVFKEIEQDMESDKPMNRLVQGDVGSGKTIIAVLSMLKAVMSGYQAVMMAPTEILATQHYESIKEFLNNYNIEIELLVGSVPDKRKKEILKKIKEGKIDIVVGTHALIQDTVEFDKLGLAITDEQHRFGVRQRAKLTQKGLNPDVLVMTATPIPRTLALILYGDLDISIIDELPPGRKKVETYAVNSKMKKRVYDFVKKQIKEGRQAYIVCPLVEESDSLDIKSATELYEELSNEYFTDLRLALLHGKMNAKDKDEIMAKFKNHEIDILISTTVIEVGVNVPNANIIVIENAERFGLAQLHQLRGRVGRGKYQSYCILINDSNSKVARERMKIMERTNNGFVISEKDLEIRGPGEFFGTRQHGIPDLKIGNIFRDMDMLKQAQKLALKILEEDRHLQSEKYKKIKNKIINLFKDKIKDISFN